jgi:hypothetical protein
MIHEPTPMLPEETLLELVLVRPEELPVGRWLDAALDASRWRLMPGLAAFSVGPSEWRIQFHVGQANDADGPTVVDEASARAVVGAATDDVVVRRWILDHHPPMTTPPADRARRTEAGAPRSPCSPT